VSIVSTDALVLHAFDYRETSRILRLATRELGVCSVIARGAKRPKSRFGTAVDLFAEGQAQIQIQGTRDLYTLTAFDVTRARTPLAGRWDRFTAASALAELVTRFAEGEPHPMLFDELRRALDALERAGVGAVGAAGLAGAWVIIQELGFTPALDGCVLCDRPLRSDAEVRFAHRQGGVVCSACEHAVAGSRRLPPHARAAIAAWLEGGDPPSLTEGEVRAHQRLLREFVQEHLADGRPLRALATWEAGSGPG
jgi:DNA repair protein RecO (recombination protein O)